MKRRTEKIIYGLLTILMILAVGAGSQLDISGLVSGLPHEESAPEPVDIEGLQITVLDVGEGLSVVFQSEGETMVYDGGDKAASSYVVGWLKDHGIAQVDLMVASHYHSDHIAGLVGILHAFPVSRVIAPDYTDDTKIYESFVNAVLAKNLTVESPKPGDSYTVGAAVVEVLGPLSDTYKDENDYSIVLKIRHGNQSVYLAGDSTMTVEDELLEADTNVEADLYIVSHHGSSGSSGQAFLNRVNPELAVISCGKDNSYGHPHDEVLEKLEKTGAKILRTDELGEIMIESDGNILKVVE